MFKLPGWLETPSPPIQFIFPKVKDSFFISRECYIIKASCFFFFFLPRWSGFGSVNFGHSSFPELEWQGPKAGCLHWFEWLCQRSLGLPWWLVVKNLPAMQWTCGRRGFGAWDRKIPSCRKWQPTAVYSFLKNPMDRGAWWATVHGVSEWDTTEQVNNNSKVTLGEKFQRQSTQQWRPH